MELKLHDQEIILQKLWKSREVLNRELVTASGKRVDVLYVGSENDDAGPDFKDAVVKIAGVLLKGDIEVHLNAPGWYAHQHHLDPAYNKVILHIISNADGEKLFIEREDGVRVEQLHIAITPEIVKKWRASGEEKKPELIIDDCPLSRAPAVKRQSTIDAAGEQRFFDKATQVRDELLTESWDQIIYRKIMEAAGYSKNKQPFRRLSELVPFETVITEMQWVAEEMAEMRCAALLFGASGLLPVSNPRCDSLTPEVLSYVEPLVSQWEQMSRRLEMKPMKAQEWQFFRLRPQNFPTRRLAGVIQLLMRFHKTGFLDGFSRSFTAHARNIRRLTTELERTLVQSAQGFWAGHYHFESGVATPSAGVAARLIGKDRARDILVNTLLPVYFVYADETHDGRLKNTVLELYARFPRVSENETTRVMTRQLQGERQGPGIVTQFAFQQQGLIQLHKRYCRPRYCEACLQLSQPDSDVS